MTPTPPLSLEIRGVASQQTLDGYHVRSTGELLTWAESVEAFESALLTSKGEIERLRAELVVVKAHKMLSLLGKSSYQEVVEERLRVELAEAQVAKEAAESALLVCRQEKETLSALVREVSEIGARERDNAIDAYALLAASQRELQEANAGHEGYIDRHNGCVVALEAQLSASRLELEQERQRSGALKAEMQTIGAEREAVWSAIEHGYDIEPRSYFEKEAPRNGFRFPLAQAFHHIWKREPKVEAQLSASRQQIAHIVQEMEAGISIVVNGEGIWQTSGIRKWADHLSGLTGSKDKEP